MKARNNYSTCFEIKNYNSCILFYPWLIKIVFDGSWFPYLPKAESIKKLKKTDYIYISHIHINHFNPAFLKKIKDFEIRNSKSFYLNVLLQIKFNSLTQ